MIRDESRLRDGGPRAGAADCDPAQGSVVFSTLWALAVLTHVWNQGSGAGWPLAPSPITDPLYWLVLVAALSLLYEPSSASRLVALAGSTVVAVVAQMPMIANHWLLAGVVSVGVLVSALRLRMMHPRLDLHVLVTDFAPLARLALLTSYGAAALAKLNTTFLDPTESCAVAVTRTITTFWGLPNPVAAAGLRVAPVATVSLELAIPVLLVWRRTRAPGIVLAGALHLAMASGPVLRVLDFTVILFALLVLFDPVAFGRLRTGVAGALQRHAPSLRRSVLSPPVRIAIVAVLGAIIGLRGLVLPNGRFMATWFLVLAGAGVLFLGGLLALAWSGSFRSSPSIEILPRRVGHWLLVVLILVSAASPYLGLRTVGTFSMFSNLRTEQVETNHLFLPRLAYFTAQDDLVEVISSSDPWLEEAAQHGDLINLVEVRRHVETDPDVSLRFVHDGREIAVERASDHPLLQPLGWLERRIQRYRTFMRDDPGSHACGRFAGPDR